jgi:hypothetical protein
LIKALTVFLKFTRVLIIKRIIVSVLTNQNF